MGGGDGAESDTTTTTKRTQRQHIIDELVKTERTYVQHLELLQEFKKLVEERGIVTGDAVHAIFLNLNALLDFQRRFLIRVEQTNAQPESEQNWGRLFVLYKEAFKVYEPYIANQKKCEETAMAEFEKLKETGGPAELRQMVESPTNLTSFLLKPFQRLAKYPLLLKVRNLLSLGLGKTLIVSQELRDKGDLDEERRDDISTGIEAASSVLKRTNEAIDLEDRKEALEELKSRVEDWKGHRIEGFGDLLLYGTFTVLKGDGGGGKDQEREVGCLSRGTLGHCARKLSQETCDISAHVPGHARLLLTTVKLVQNLPIRNDSALLQGTQPQQAEEQIDEQQATV